MQNWGHAVEIKLTLFCLCSSVGRSLGRVHSGSWLSWHGVQKVSMGSVLVFPPALFQIPLHRLQGALSGRAGQEGAGSWKGVSSSTLLKQAIVFRPTLFCFKANEWHLKFFFCPAVRCDWSTVHWWSSNPRSSWWKRRTPRQICVCCRVSIAFLIACMSMFKAHSSCLWMKPLKAWLAFPVWMIEILPLMSF